MIDLEELNEVEQKAIVNQYIKKQQTPMLNNEKVILPHRMMVGYRCVRCKDMKYVRVYKKDLPNIANTIGCRCDKNTYMRIRYYGASNIAMLTSIEVTKKIFTLDDFL